MIRVEQLTHVYEKGLPQETVALDNVSFELDDGETAVLIGHTGSGKSTLVQHLNGLLKADSGHIYVSDADLTAEGTKLSEIRRRVGLVFQYPEYQLFEETVLKDVCFDPLNLGLSKEEAEKKAEEALALVGLGEEIFSRSPCELSGGQKRRVAIAGVLAMGPEVLILDEPTAGLDPESRNDILELIDKIHKITNNTTILVSHNMEDAARMADKILVMDHGRLVMQGSPREIFTEGERLREMGLDLPPVTQLMYELSARGLAVRTDIFTPDEAEEEILRVFREGGGADA